MDREICLLLLLGVVGSACGGLLGCGSNSSGKPCESMPELGNPCASGLGACSTLGKLACSEDGSTLVCDAAPGAAKEESCDGVDNNCDGQTDENLADSPVAGLLGVCAGAVVTCMGKEGWSEPDFAKIAGYEATEASCDGLDNDCDGKTDAELADAPPDTCPGKGVCEGKGLAACTAGSWGCDLSGAAGYETVEATCDGKDNDCDGDVDEDLVGGTDAGCSGKGVCAAGVKTVCDAGTWVCDYAALDGYEAPEASCDGLDNDCDGQVDEDIGGAPPDTCPGVGVCEGKGTAGCAAGSWGCDLSGITGYEPQEKSCDGLDNDCDGKTDEALGASPASADCADQGVCETGVVMVCKNGTWDCEYGGVEGWQPVDASCDGLDNDCDGQTDEGWACTSGCDDVAPGTVRCSAPIAGDGTPAVTADGIVYVTGKSTDSGKSVLASLDAADCSVNWELASPAQDIVTCLSPVVRSDGNILYPCVSPYTDVQSPVYLVSPAGQLLATHLAPLKVAPTELAVTSDGTYYFGNRHCCGDFYAYKSDGTIKWSIATGGSEFDGSPIIGQNGWIYAATWKFKGSPEEKVYAFKDNGGSGEVVWSFSPPENSEPYDTSGIFVNSWPALHGGSTLYVGILGKLGEEWSTTLYALDSSNGTEKWHYSVPGDSAGLNSALVVGEDGTVYMVTGHFGDGLADPTQVKLHAVSKEGKAVWPVPFAAEGFTWNIQPAIGADGNLYLSTQDAAYAIDGETGGILWETAAVAGGSIGTTLGHDGTAFFQTTSGFYAVCSNSGGLAPFHWPKALYGYRNTAAMGSIY